MNMKPHKKLAALKKSMELVEKLYKLTNAFPREEVSGLTAQIRRTAVFVPSNIAEGAAGRSPVHFRNYLLVAIGSVNEIATQLEIVRRIGYLDAATFAAAEALVDECLAITYGLRRSIRS
jgi:four helix bundle protein